MTAVLDMYAAPSGHCGRAGIASPTGIGRPADKRDTPARFPVQPPGAAAERGMAGRKWIPLGEAIDRLAAEYAVAGDDLQTARADARITILAKLKAPEASVARPLIESATGYYLSISHNGFSDYGKPGEKIPAIFWRVIGDLAGAMETEDWRGGNFKFAGIDRHGFMCTGHAYDVQVPRLWPTGDVRPAIAPPAKRVRTTATIPRNRQLDHDALRKMARLWLKDDPGLTKGSAAESIRLTIPANPKSGKLRDKRGIERIIAPVWEESGAEK